MKALLPTEHILKLIPKQKQLCNQSTSIWGGGPSSHLGKYTWKLQRDGVMPSLFLQHRHRTEYSTSFFQDLLFYLIEWVMPLRKYFVSGIISLPYGSPATGFSTDSPALCMTVDAYVLADINAKFDPAKSYFDMIVQTGWWILSDPSGHNHRHVKQSGYSSGPNDQ